MLSMKNASPTSAVLPVILDVTYTPLDHAATQRHVIPL